MAGWSEAWPQRVRPEDHAAILRLNQAHEIETSPLDAAALAALVNQSYAAYTMEGGTAGFVIALDETADYASPNFCWFRSRHDRFVYIDRIIVAPAARGRGIARQLYGAVIEAMAGACRTLLVCEVNARPPNPLSDRLHASLGFYCVGTAELGSGKLVRYLRLDTGESRSLLLEHDDLSPHRPSPPPGHP